MKPLQIVGAVGVVVFGALFVRQLLAPERDPFSLPGAMPLNDSRAPAEFPVPGSSANIPPPLDPAALPEIARASAPGPAADPLLVGSEGARDDLYCSGLIFAAHRASGDTLSGQAQARRDKVIALAEAGVTKLIEEGAADASGTGAIADAHAEVALADYAAGTPRITVEECEARPTN